jgi:hypothetical protein
MIKDGDIPAGRDGTLHPALAPDNSIPAADIKGDTGPGAQFKRPRYGQPSPEVRMGGNNKIAVDLHVPFEIRSFLCIKRITLL